MKNIFKFILFSTFLFQILLFVDGQLKNGKETNKGNIQNEKETNKKGKAENEQLLPELLEIEEHGEKINTPEFKRIYTFVKNNLKNSEKVEEMKDFLENLTKNTKKRKILKNFNNYDEFIKYKDLLKTEEATLIKKLKEAGKKKLYKNKKLNKTKKILKEIIKAEKVGINNVLLSLDFCKKIDQNYKVKEIVEILKEYCEKNILEKASEVLEAGGILINEKNEENSEKKIYKQNTIKNFYRSVSRFLSSVGKSKSFDSLKDEKHGKSLIPRIAGNPFRRVKSEGDFTKFTFNEEGRVQEVKKEEDLMQNKRKNSIFDLFRNKTNKLSLDDEEQKREKYVNEKSIERGMPFDEYLRSYI
ncbi:hypothetical protein ACQ4LE_000104 [Meloidogyne hapla]|uniref:Uncharacterized protein n=1 Tax=Meloidogyne hapla TaxID=6305 RepID=A0A1I8B9N7_MELHA